MLSFDGSEYAKARNRLGLIQVEAEELSGVSRRVIQKIEANDRSVSPQSRRRLAIALGMMLDEQADSDDSGKDAFWDLPSVLFSHLTRFAKFMQSDAARCNRLHDAETTVKRMRENWKLHLSQVCDLNRNSRLQRIDQMLDDRCEEYIDRYVQIWHLIPEALMCSTSNGQRTGASIVLPVSDTAYNDFVSGKRGYMDIRRKDVVPQSQNLIYDSGVEFLDAPRASWYAVTSSLSATIFYQTAVLSRNVSAPDFRIASFEASPMNAKRLKAVGFVRNGSKTSEYQLPICEFASRPTVQNINDDEAEDIQATSVFLANRLKNKLSKRTDPDRNGRLRRRTMLSALAIYQRLLRSNVRSRAA